MRRLGFQPPSPVDEPPPGDGTTSVVGVQDGAAKGAVAEGTVYERLDDGPFVLKPHVIFPNAVGIVRRVDARRRVILPLRYPSIEKLYFVASRMFKLKAS